MATLLLREQFLPEESRTFARRLRDPTGLGWVIRGVHYSIITPTRYTPMPIDAHSCSFFQLRFTCALSADATLGDFPRFCGEYEYASKAAALQLKGFEACFDLANFAPMDKETAGHTEEGFALPMVKFFAVFAMCMILCVSLISDFLHHLLYHLPSFRLHTWTSSASAY